MASKKRTGIGMEGHALLAWFSSIASPDQKLVVKDLTDGLAIWSMLQQIRPEVFTGNLPDKGDRTTRSWLANWQNLKHIYKSLASYIVSEAGRLPKSLDGLDLQAVAKDEATADAIQLLKMVLFAAVNADHNAPYITPMALLPPDQQSLVQEAILEIQDIAEPIDTNDEVEPPFSGDKDLYWEEQLSIMAREKESLAADKKDLLVSLQEQSERNIRLTSNNSSLQDKLSSLQDKLEHTSGTSVGGPALKLMENRLKERDDHIAYQEAQIIDLQNTADELERDASKYRELQGKFQPLQDAHDELKAERDSLLRKANTMDKYKAKLQTLTDLEKENESLRSGMDELREVNKDGTLAIEQARAFEMQLEEMSRMIPAIEQELFESKRMKQQLDDSARQMRRQLDDANARYEEDQGTIRDLMDQMQPGSSQAQENESLENELDQDKNNRKDEKSHVEHAKIAKDLREALAEREVRYKALESMLAAAKFRSAKLESIIEQGPVPGTDADRFKGSLFAIPAQTALADLELRNQERQRMKDAELQRERELLGTEDCDSAILMEKHELDRMRGFEAAAGESDTLRAQIKDLQAQLLKQQNTPKEKLLTQEVEIKELRKQLEASIPALLKASEQLQLKQQLENLKRENRLVTSAFYDLSSRLQLNNVSLQRRSEAPRSFLNKQRILVSQATAVRMPR